MSAAPNYNRHPSLVQGDRDARAEDRQILLGVWIATETVEFHAASSTVQQTLLIAWMQIEMAISPRTRHHIGEADETLAWPFR